MKDTADFSQEPVICILCGNSTRAVWQWVEGLEELEC